MTPPMVEKPGRTGRLLTNFSWLAGGRTTGALMALAATVLAARALGAHGAWLLAPYEALPHTPGLVLEPVEDIEHTAEIAVKHGFQVNTHAIGDRAIRLLLDRYEDLEAENGPRDRRYRIEHAQHLHPDDIPRFAELGVIAAMQAKFGLEEGSEAGMSTASAFSTSSSLP